MISPNLSLPDDPASAGARPRRAAVSTVAALALLLLPIMTSCSPQSSSSSSGGSSTDPVVARVNGFEIRESHLVMAEDDLGVDLQQLAPEVRRDHIISYVADIVLVAQAAEGRNVQNGDDFKQRLAFLRSKLLMGLFLQEHARTSANDEAIRRVYDEQIKPMVAAEEVRAPYPVPRRSQGREGAGGSRGAGARRARTHQEG